MRARNIKPALYKDEDLATLPRDTRYLFPGLWMLADCEGRLEDRPKMIKVEIYPYDEDIGAASIHLMLQQLHDKGIITRYSVDGCNFIQVNNFKKHQNPHKQEREKGSCIPPAPKPEVVPVNSESVPIKTEAVPLKTEVVQNLTEAVPVSTGVTPDDSLFLIPDSLNLNPEVPLPTGRTPKPAKRSENSPSYEELLEGWTWYQAQYPKEVNGHVERQLYLSVMETREDLAALKTNLPLYKQKREWKDGYVPSSENFLSKRIFLVKPKNAEAESPAPPKYDKHLLDRDRGTIIEYPKGYKPPVIDPLQ